MTNGTRLGLGVGADLDLGNLVLGWNYAGGWLVARQEGLNDLESAWGLGGRVILSPELYLTATWIVVPGDAYGHRTQAAMAGVGFAPGLSGSAGFPTGAPMLVPSPPSDAPPAEGGLIRRSR